MSSKKAIGIGLIGFGNIGTGVVRALEKNKNELNARLNRPLELIKIADIDTRTRRDVPYKKSLLIKDARRIIDDPRIDIVIELIGGIEPAKTFIERALRKGKHVVTANKALMAGHSAELLTMANRHNALLRFEASVGAGIPIIGALLENLQANRFERVYGIINGTANYVLSSMEHKGTNFRTALKEAQRRGFAEPDPTFDIEGFDTAHKIAILASIAFGQDIRFEDVYVEGITHIGQDDLVYAGDLGYTIKLLGIAQRNRDGRVEVRVHPSLIPKDFLLASVTGEYNCIMIDGSPMGMQIYYGKGAGQESTSSAVIGDVMAIARAISEGRIRSQKKLNIPVGEKHLKPIAELETSYYINLCVRDIPGAMAQLSGILGNNRISIASIIQKTQPPCRYANAIIVTHLAIEARIQKAMDEIAALKICHSQKSPFVLRVTE